MIEDLRAPVLRSRMTRHRAVRPGKLGARVSRAARLLGKGERVLHEAIFSHAELRLREQARRWQQVEDDHARKMREILRMED